MVDKEAMCGRVVALLVDGAGVSRCTRKADHRGRCADGERGPELDALEAREAEALRSSAGEGSPLPGASAPPAGAPSAPSDDAGRALPPDVERMQAELATLANAHGYLIVTVGVRVRVNSAGTGGVVEWIDLAGNLPKRSVPAVLRGVIDLFASDEADATAKAEAAAGKVSP